MTDRIEVSSALSADIDHGYLAASDNAPRHDNPLVVLNEDGLTALSALRHELARCERFLFSVAFVTPAAVALLIQSLKDFSGQGTIVTSTYLGFNSPAAFAELLKLQDLLAIDVRLHVAKGFHAKGYVFERPGMVTAMVGSSNLTPPALTLNHEWNLKVSATRSSDLGRQFHELIESQRSSSAPLTREWIEQYASTYTAPVHQQQGATGTSALASVPEPFAPSGKPALEFDTLTEPTDGRIIPARVELLTESRPTVVPGGVPRIPTLDPRANIQPNSMQVDALAALADARSAGATRALLISATGTGKTILSALDVRQAAPQRLLFVVHREQIVDKTIEEYRRVLGGTRSDFGKLSGTSKNPHARYVFATVQTLSQPHILESFDSNAFEYVIFDEAHRAASVTHRRVLDHFTPDFLLGMTATPERPDGINVYELFDFVVPYEIRLKEALEAEMLAPFHYYGIADVVYDDGSTTDDFTELSRLSSPKRISHLVKALEFYGQAGVAPRGLIFGSSKAEVRALAAALNQCSLRGRPLRAAALTGENSIQERRAVVGRFERGDLDYILSVDVFNEGVDIPTVNQIVMLRQTQSAIVFVQQLGRGLRKAPGKDYLVVIDFIGNYANNFLIPVALFGNESLNKESLRKELIAAEESGVMAGLSSVHFDKISHARVLQSIADTALDSIHRLKVALVAMKNRVGRNPTLWDFHRFESVDPVLLATKKEHFPALLASLLKVPFSFSQQEQRALQLVAHEVFPAKRLHEVILLRALLERGTMSTESIQELFRGTGIASDPHTVSSTVDTFTLSQHAEVDVKRYRTGIAVLHDSALSLTPHFRGAYDSCSDFRKAVDDMITTGEAIVRSQYSLSTTFTPGAQYSRKEVTRLLRMPRKWTSTLYGYKADPSTMVCPLFVTLHKSNDVTASTAYEDALVDRSTMVWFTKSSRTLQSPLESAIVANKYWLPVFVKKDDAEGTGFYYLGDATVHDAVDTTMRNDKGATLPVVKTELRFERPIDAGLYNYFHPVLTE